MLENTQAMSHMNVCIATLSLNDFVTILNRIRITTLRHVYVAHILHLAYFNLFHAKVLSWESLELTSVLNKLINLVLQ